MMAIDAWTAKRLDALPEGTVIGWAEGTYPEEAVRQGRFWRTLSGLAPYSEGVIEDADPGSIRVVSVPIEALLHPRPGSFDLGRIDPTSEAALMVVRAAIAHITGEPS